MEAAGVGRKLRPKIEHGVGCPLRAETERRVERPFCPATPLELGVIPRSKNQKPLPPLKGALMSNRALGDVDHANLAGKRILAHNAYVSNDTRETNLNNNDLIVGPTGGGKTRYYVKPNLLQMNESFIVTDTKGSLVEEVGSVLKDHGYRVVTIDFNKCSDTYGYNPFDFVRIDPRTKKVCEQDILKIADAIVPLESSAEPFWDHAARNLLGCLIAFMFECLNPAEHTIGTVIRLLGGMKVCEGRDEEKGETEKLLEAFCNKEPNSFTARRWTIFKATTGSPRTYGSILAILAEKMEPFTFDGALNMFMRAVRIDFTDLGREKMALFLTVSDTDRSMDRIVSLLYTQALQTLCDYADYKCAGHGLSVPVRLFLDDFATNCRIADFDKIISVIRSRNIAVSIVLQSITQLETLYTHPAALTIVNGCDHLLYLGGQDVETARVIAMKAHKTVDTILDQNVGEIWLFERGSRAKKVRRYELTSHPLYNELAEAQVNDLFAQYEQWVADTAEPVQQIGEKPDAEVSKAVA